MNPAGVFPPDRGVLTHLRTSTRSLHERLESRLDLPESLRTLADYRRLLEDFYGFYNPFEASLAAADWNGTGIVIEERRKLPLLRDDLGRLGLTVEALQKLPLCSDTPAVADRAAAFGGLYVLEGATLGGQLISRHVHERFGDDGSVPCAFFASYGEAVGRMWRSFREALSSSCRPVESDRVAASAARTFESLEAWLFRPRG